jgi:GT2 family glycosyltransferase/glycosyltransferase involved in cell wall biosynthesis
MRVRDICAGNEFSTICGLAFFPKIKSRTRTGVQQTTRAWVEEPGRLERGLLAFGRARLKLANAIWPRLHARAIYVARSRAMRVALWAITLRLPGELGFWLRARRLRGGGGLRSGGTRLFVARSARPTVSIVIPTYGKAALTLRCLGAIAAAPPAASIEVIVVDDCSSDPKLGRLRRVRGLRLVSTPTNQGFIGAANHGASLARGEMVLFLNNDAFVRPGAIDALVDTLRTRQDAGAAGAKLLFPDGRLQEAGCIVWQDGGGSNYGRGDDPGRPEYNYVRPADYCSAAALIVRRDLFAALGGFDPHFAPAYYEDTDLAFRLRAQGHLTLYQPLAEVVHLEGASHGTDPARGIKAHQRTNRAKFVERWENVLNRTHLPPCGNPVRARDGAGGRRVALVLEHRPPEPDRDAGSQNLASILASLQGAGLAVKLWVETVRDHRYVRALQQQGIEVAFGDVGAFERWIARHGAAIDHVVISRPHVAAAHLGPLHLHCTAPLAYNGMDLHGRRTAMQAALRDDAALAEQAMRVEHLERWIWRSVDVSLYLSDEEAETARALEPAARIAAIAPFCFETFPDPRPATRTRDMLFVGGFAHTPNGDAMLWFAEEVLPLVLARVPEARLVIAGSEMPERVRALASESVILAPDIPAAGLRTLYAHARISIAPLRFGAGVKLKVVEALREGTPLVTTPVGAQGLPGLADIASVAEDPAQFADAVCALLEDDALWEARSAAQIAYARTWFSRARFDRTLLDALGLPPPKKPRSIARAPRKALEKPAAAAPRRRRTRTAAPAMVAAE